MADNKRIVAFQNPQTLASLVLASKNNSRGKKSYHALNIKQTKQAYCELDEDVRLGKKKKKR